jgi:murein endopeptidase
MKKHVAKTKTNQKLRQRQKKIILRKKKARQQSKKTWSPDAMELIQAMAKQNEQKVPPELREAVEAMRLNRNEPVELEDIEDSH